MKNNNKVSKDFYEPNMKQVQTDVSKSISERLDKMESMLLYGINKMEEIDKKLDDFINTINIRMVGKTGEDIFKIY
jgi:uncharacterized protein YaaN involved in tellurite resistance